MKRRPCRAVRGSPTRTEPDWMFYLGDEDVRLLLQSFP
jgi:hypothetical protein